MLFRRSNLVVGRGDLRFFCFAVDGDNHLVCLFAGLAFGERAEKCGEGLNSLGVGQADHLGGVEGFKCVFFSILKSLFHIVFVFPIYEVLFLIDDLEAVGRDAERLHCG